uniref:PAN-1 domain and Apple-like domain-containing protein n=1 Tax=Strongyloides venezuelensis TaxID=75913 RepID=A0A0K0F9B8_STRVS
MIKILVLSLFIYLIIGDNNISNKNIHKRRKYRRKPKYVSEEDFLLTSTTVQSSSHNIDRIVTEVADISDPCFRKFSHTTIFNSQPFERKSGISLNECKEKCLKNIKYLVEKKLSKLLKCQSIVYSKEICDLYSHIGDEGTSILVRLNNSHYFEPSMEKTCFEEKKKIMNIELKQNPKKNYIPNSIEDQIIESSFYPMSFKTSNSIRRKQPFLSKSGTVNIDTYSPKSISMDIKKKIPHKTCEHENKVERYLKVSGFELINNNEIILKNTNYEKCSNICNLNEINNEVFKCKSFNLLENVCSLSSERAVPLGNGQLKKNLTSNYYEKICADKNLMKGCPNIFERYPQKILVGFAEMVIDASSFEECFNICLEAKKNFGFFCQSGMYYFDERTLNCILNTETKNTQSSLFTDELHDIVDYFETSCTIDMNIENKEIHNKTRNKNMSSKEKIQLKRDMDEGTLLIPSPTKEINKEFLQNINPKWIVVQ